MVASAFFVLLAVIVAYEIDRRASHREYDRVSAQARPRRKVCEMTIDFGHLTQNWKTTLQSILTTTFAITGTLMVSSVIKPQTAAILVTVNGICKVVLGVFQTDGSTLPPGTNIKTSITTPQEK